ncbi:complement component 7b [Fundulus heteroclitus]|uniref:complement component 7b n=1 Tax=Fundulus heteroclitus TaxID=8078 RepID=UPI00165B432E|nr:complement component 7b [Fundulus heteroclitus]
MTLSITGLKQTRRRNSEHHSMKLHLVPALALVLTLVSPICCQQRVNCRWGSYGAWSECDACTRTKLRTRHVAVYAQFGGAPCSGEATETQPCVPGKACPVETGCGGRFRCTSGQCISQSLVCNGDQDCEDGLDEQNCGQDNSQYSCDLIKTPPNADLTGKGYDVLTGKLMAGVINTFNFGGQCRKVFSGNHKVMYRLPQNILRFSFVVHVNNEESDESYESSWSYAQHIQSNALIGHDRRSFHKEAADNKAYRLIILKNRVELAQFQNSAPQYLPLSVDFWKALSSLPLTYDYSAYRQVLKTYGTHYMSEGSLGGEYQGLLELDLQSDSSHSVTDIEYQRCWKKVKRFLFIKKTKVTCEKLQKHLESRAGGSSHKMPIKVNVFGGDPSFIGALSVLDLQKPEANGEIYNNWAASVQDFPDIINQKLRPLYELVKEVQCAGLKKLYLKRAMEEYLTEEHPCHCRPCLNNGQPLLTGTECRCVCRPGTSGPACERGAVIGQQPGVIHGSWSCWSSWGTCSGGQRSRTRSCNNPAPRGGGQNCIGEQREQKPCEEPDIQYLQMMEPQCFGLSITPPKQCGPPPILKNGFVENLQDFYTVGSRVQYSCIEDYYLVGSAVSRCGENQQWSTEEMVCKSSTCRTPQVNSLVEATPIRDAYNIGDSVSLSCPAGSVLDGDVSEIVCSSSLQWSPSPADIQCKTVLTEIGPPNDLKCKPWEKIGKSGCVCKMPSECASSVEFCTRIGPRNLLLGVCQLGALRCLGRNFMLAGPADCNRPQETFTSCEDCKPGTICQESQQKCICQSPSACPGDSFPVCVSSGDDGAAVTMTECEVGARRCAGETINLISIEACPQ